ncbi:hypothetical protein ACO0QE_001124 [Hanseniaspora vineae]
MARVGSLGSSSAKRSKARQTASEKNAEHAARLGLVNKNPLISSIAVLAKNPLKDDALKMMYDIAHRVSYLMKEEKFKVYQLVEFYPKDKRLLGMNVNRGQKILLRLRYPEDEFRFLPMESVMGTMLHELTHNVFGPHCNKFYSKLDDLTSKQWVYEQQGLFNHFLGSGKKLGGRTGNTGARVGTLSTLTSNGTSTTALSGKVVKPNRGLKLGGTRPKDFTAKTPKEMAAIAAQRRFEDNEWCRHNHEALLEPEDSELEIIELDNDDLLLNKGVDTLQVVTEGSRDGESQKLSPNKDIIEILSDEDEDIKKVIINSESQTNESSSDVIILD